MLNEVPISAKELFQPNVYIVKLEVVLDDTDNDLNSFQVREVYVGPDTLKGERIDSPTYGCREILTTGNPFARQGLLERGDVGLFVIAQKGNSKSYRVLGPQEAGEYNVKCAIHQNKQFKRYTELAELARKLYQATDQTRLHKIDELLTCGDVLKAYTAFWYLKQVKDERIVDYLIDLSRDKSLPVEVQMDLNDTLRDRKKGWAGSTAELELVAGWFNGPWKTSVPARDYHPASNVPPKLAYLFGDEEDAVRAWLVNVVAAKRYSVRQLVDLAAKGIANAQRSGRFKQELFAIVNGAAKVTWEAKSRAEGASYLIEQIAQAPDSRQKAAAAKLLGAFAPLDEAHTKELRALLAAGPDEAVAAELRALLDKKK